MKIMLLAKCVLLLFCYHQLLGGAVSKFTPNAFPAKISSQCGQYDHHHEELLLEALQQVKQVHSSCESIHYSNPSACSGYYQIQTANGGLVQVYCDMEGANCGGEGGWTRVFQLNMTDPSSQCPTGFSLTTQNGIRFCTRSNTAAGCTGINTENIGHPYTQVCGFVRGYTFDTPDAFAATGRTSSEPLSGNYVDGISITYGTPPNHLWTYAAGLSETGGFYVGLACPCNTNGPNNVPTYVSSNYYCEAGVSGDPNIIIPPVWYTDDPLWDGMLCRGTEGPCCNSTSLPWFVRNMHAEHYC